MEATPCNGAAAALESGARALLSAGGEAAPRERASAELADTGAARFELPKVRALTGRAACGRLARATWQGITWHMACESARGRGALVQQPSMRRKPAWASADWLLAGARTRPPLCSATQSNAKAVRALVGLAAEGRMRAQPRVGAYEKLSRLYALRFTSERCAPPPTELLLYPSALRPSTT